MCIYNKNFYYTHTHTHTHIYMYVCMYLCMYVCMYVCICKKNIFLFVQRDESQYFKMNGSTEIYIFLKFIYLVLTYVSSILLAFFREHLAFFQVYIKLTVLASLLFVLISW